MGAVVGISPAGLQVDPGGQAVCTVRVVNRSPVVEEFTIQVLGDAARWASVEPERLSIFPDGEATAIVRFTAPRQPDLSGSVPFGVMVKAKTDESTTVEEGTIAVAGFVDVDVSLRPRTSTGKGAAKHKVLLTNKGNSPTSVVVGASDPDEQLVFRVQPEEVELAAGATATVELGVKAKHHGRRGSMTPRPFQVHVQVAGQPSRMVDGTMQQKGGTSFGPVAKLAIVVGVAVLAVGLFASSKKARDAVSQTINLTSKPSPTDQADTTDTEEAPVDENAQSTPDNGQQSNQQASKSGGSTDQSVAVVGVTTTVALRSTATSTGGSGSATTAAPATTTTAPPATTTTVKPIDESVGVKAGSGVEVTDWGTGRLDLFTRGSDCALWHSYYTGSWSAWESLGGCITTDPAAVSWSSGRIDVFARGTDNALYHKYFAGGWSGWESLGGALTSGPAVASWGPGRLDIFVKNTANALSHIWYDSSTGWGTWENMDGYLTSDPAAVSWSSGRIDVFARGGDNALWHKYYAGGWSGWESLGGILTSGPAAASWAPGRLDVFVRNANNGLSQLTFDTNWKPWVNLGGTFGGDPAATSWGSGRIDVFYRSGDDIRHRWYDAGAWKP